MSQHDPAECSFCGDRAIGIGMGFTSPRDKDPKFLCVDCSFMIDNIQRLKRPDAYKLKARAGGMDAAGPLVEEYGSDLGEWTEEQVLIFCGRIWDGCTKRLRQLVRSGDAPF
ncbi:hypothetical protein [Mesorhizobium sp. NZP2298]|uniref:hypothetical protein n=1 Tax=Mesorhizobium sp. NZP2298 TaxID=2483403 RepID=UPI001551FAEA|nr:hypothetical protein [Mesorhizobium sp. NZP2298]QKC99200.1 hypothetical protein EB231_35020 [Mesorhizobium sp. NZP2298]